MNLRDKVVVITGASEGLGEVLAKKISQSGAKVVLVARSEEKLKKLTEEIGESAYYFVCDITRLESVKKTVLDVKKAFGRIDVLLNNAGMWTDDSIEEKNPEKRQEAFNTNALGTIQMTEEVLPLMKGINGGYIFTVISTSGDMLNTASDNRFWKTYGATKWALTGYTKALRDSLQDTKIHVTSFFPGGFDSNLYENAKRENPHNQPWMMKMDDIADVVLFCLTRPEDMTIESLVVTKKM